MKTVGFACFFHLAAEIGCFPFGIEGDFWQACSVGRFFSSGLAEWEMSVFGRNFIIYYPRTGGVIVSKAANRAEAEAFTREDPFFRHEIADYTIVEFEPTKYLPGFEKFR